MNPAFLWSPRYDIDIGRHVFPTRKFRLLKDLLIARGTIREEDVTHCPAATDEELLTVLIPQYLTDLKGHVHTPRTMRSELPITREIIEGMIHTVGGTIACVRHAMKEGVACHIGGGYHHGFADHAEGFCYINDVAIAARVALKDGIARRIAIVDTDVHQGNGTASIFGGEHRVYTFSIHQENIYPMNKETSDMDIGLGEMPGQDRYLSALARGLKLAVAGFAPDLVIHVAGVDPYKEDQLGGLGLEFDTMRRRDVAVAQAARAAGAPIVTVVAGGYSRNTDDTVALHAQTIEATLKTLGHLSE